MVEVAIPLDVKSNSEGSILIAISRYEGSINRIPVSGWFLQV